MHQERLRRSSGIGKPTLDPTTPCPGEAAIRKTGRCGERGSLPSRGAPAQTLDRHALARWQL
ncbi:hypothetical protein HDA39_006913 [Kribbella italica]|uniref:Uncharacterized protein n=1 Tax=Kribbella italica TaxID=1540520 RepID=A0A7W9MXU9_9ACTN|nr:hypothetical protein [Kribbella italica]